jgi:O-succinylbenzoate synthase
MALATLPNFRFPGDISESSRYYHEDIVEPDITLRTGGTLRLPHQPGIGFEINFKRLEQLKQYEERFLAS